MSIMDMFKAAPTPAVPVTAQASNTGAPASNVDTNTLVPNTNNTPGAQAAADGTPLETPMDGFKDLWQTPAGGGKGNEKLFNLDPTKLHQAVSGFDFTKVIKPEEFAAVTAGGEGATKALATILNKVTQTAMAANINQTANLIQQAVDRNNASFESRVPGLIKAQNVSEANRLANPLFNNPATAPMMQALEAQLLLKNPTATQAEISAHVQNYINEMIALGRQPEMQQEQQVAAAKETDWLKVFDVS